MTRKLFGLYRSYRLGVADVFGMVMLGLLVLAAIAIAISTTTTNVHPGMLGLGVVVVVIIMFTLICGWQEGEAIHDQFVLQCFSSEEAVQREIIGIYPTVMMES